MDTKKIDRILSNAIQLIEKESGGAIALGPYEIWCEDGFRFKMKPKKSYRDWLDDRVDQLMDVASTPGRKKEKTNE